MNYLKKTLPLLILCSAVLSSFAFRPMEKKFTGFINCVYYLYTGTYGGEHNPANYILMWPQPFSWPVCSDPDIILCAICVDPWEIYPQSDPTYPNLPKVDVPGTWVYSAIINAWIGSSDIYDVDISSNLTRAVELKP